MGMQIPGALKELNALSFRLEMSDLSLSQLDRVAKRASQIVKKFFESLRENPWMDSMTDEVMQTAERVIGRADEIRHSLIARDVSLLPEITGLEAKVLELFLTEYDLDPEAMAEELIQMGKQIEALENQGIISPKVLAKLKRVKDQLGKLIFRFEFPIVRDLKEFAQELHELAVEV